MAQRLYIQVLLPLKLDWNPWYWTEEEVHVGQRVAVIFAHKPMVAMVLSVGGTPDIDESRIEALSSVETGLADISAGELELWNFVADYYMCTLGEVFKAAYPHSKVRSEKVAADKDRRSKETHLRMRIALEKKVSGLVARLSAKDKALEARAASSRGSESVTARLKEERAGIAAQLDAARKALEIFDATMDAGDTGKPTVKPFKAGKPVLVRGFDRLEKYFEYVEACLASGHDALVLEPETDLGFNIEKPFESRFGDKVRIFNGVISPVQRRRLAEELRSSDHSPVVIIGLRTALFLPYDRLGLIIVDEEQDSSYKQTEPAPRYNGRDVAAVLASYCGAQLILGSACPSLETLLNVQTGKYAVCGDGSGAGSGSGSASGSGCQVDIIDINAERRKRGMIGDFSRKAIAAVNEAVRCAGSSQPLITIVRCYCTEEEAARQASELFPGQDPQILTSYAARKSSARSAVTVVLQADSMFDRTDFRADEKALQMLTMLKAHTDHLVVQTGSGDHPVFAALCGLPYEDALLGERRQFKLPPFAKIVDVYDRKSGALVSRELLPRDRNLASRKAELFAKYSKTSWFDVDPL